MTPFPISENGPISGIVSIHSAAVDDYDDCYVDGDDDEYDANFFVPERLFYHLAVQELYRFNAFVFQLTTCRGTAS